MVTERKTGLRRPVPVPYIDEKTGEERKRREKRKEYEIQ